MSAGPPPLGPPPGDRSPARRRSLSRWLPLLVLVVVAAAALVLGSQRSPGHATLGQRTEALASEVRCPVCEGETAAESNTPQSINIRTVIRQELAGGEKPASILDGLVAAYGPGILEDPQTRGADLLLWVLPIAIAAVAVSGLGLGFRYWRVRATERGASAEERALVAGALERPPAGR